MGKISFKGVEEMSFKIRALNADMTDISKKMVYSGADAVANDLRKAIATIPDDLLNEVQRQGLKDGLGVAHIVNEDGRVNTRIGFAGYNAHKVGKYKNTGQPNAMIARVVAKGVSWRAGKYDFVKIALKNSRKNAQSAMQEVFNEEIEKHMRG